jgi:hypothetical protein
VRGTIFQIGIEPNRVDVVTSIDGVEFDDAWPRRVESRYDDVAIAILGVDDLLTNKRTVGRAPDRLDIENLERALRSR